VGWAQAGAGGGEGHGGRANGAHAGGGESPHGGERLEAQVRAPPRILPFF